MRDPIFLAVAAPVRGHIESELPATGSAWESQDPSLVLLVASGGRSLVDRFGAVHAFSGFVWAVRPCIGLMLNPTCSFVFVRVIAMKKLSVSLRM